MDGCIENLKGIFFTFPKKSIFIKITIQSNEYDQIEETPLAT